MNEYIQIFNNDTIERKCLELAALKMTENEKLNNSDIYFTVGETYFDYGQDWMWTTLIAHNPKETGVLASYQALNPAQQTKIINTLKDTLNNITER